MRKIFTSAVFSFVFVLGVSIAMADSVYFVAGGDPALPRNTVYMDLLGDGLTILDESNNEVFIPGLGYDVMFADEDVDDPAEAADYDLVIVHESLSSGNAGAYIDKAIPLIVIEQALAWGNTAKEGSLYFAASGGAMNNVDGEFEVIILDNTHPITSIYDQDEILQVTNNYSTSQIYGILSDQLAPAATPLVETGLNAGELRVTVAVADTGATGLLGDGPIPEGADPTPERRAYFGLHEMVHVFDNGGSGIENIALTKDGAVLFQRVVQWTIGNPVTADGTEGGTFIRNWELH